MGTLLFLKHENFAVPPGARVLKAADYAILTRAGEMLDLAAREAAAIRAAAGQVYAEEKERGYADGLAEGKMETAASMMETLTSGIDYLAGLEERVVDLVMQVVCKVIQGFDDKALVLGLVRKALTYARSQKRVTLRVCPGDAELVQAHLQELLRDHPGIGILDVAADPRLQKGACLLESELGIIDAGLDVQLQGIRKAFLRQLQTRQRGGADAS
jgi:type III secretion protein L